MPESNRENQMERAEHVFLPALPGQKIIAITGTIGSGKSTVVKILASRYPVIDCDRVNAELLCQAVGLTTRCARFLLSKWTTRDKSTSRRWRRRFLATQAKRPRSKVFSIRVFSSGCRRGSSSSKRRSCLWKCRFCLRSAPNAGSRRFGASRAMKTSRCSV